MTTTFQGTLSAAEFARQFEPLLAAPMSEADRTHLARILADTIAIADHARRHRTGGCAVDDIENDGAGAAEIWGTDRRTSPSTAAFMNGSAAETLDFQEVLIDGRNNGHSAVVVVPALVALDSMAPDSGDRLLRSLWIAFAANLFLARALGRGHRTNGPGFRTTSLTAPVAAALGAGYLIGDAETATHACALAAANLPAGLLASLAPVGGSFSVDKDLAVGTSARHAVQCALLASNGATGPETALTGYGSWLNSYGFDTADAGYLHGDPTAADLSAYALKYYPTSFGSQAAIRIALGLGTRIPADDIAQIDVFVKTSSFKNAVKGKLSTHVAARFSLVYAVASTFLRRRCTLEEFEDAAIQEPAVLDLMAKIRLHAVPAYEDQHLSHGVFPCRIVATDGSGQTYEDELAGPLDGWSETDLAAAFEAKLHTLCLTGTADRLLKLTQGQDHSAPLAGVHALFSTGG